MSTQAQPFLPFIDWQYITALLLDEQYFEAFDNLTEPFREELYKRQTFDFLNEINLGQALLICYDYTHNQVVQGGFIQLIQNNYVTLLLPLFEGLQLVGATGMAQLVDDVLKVYVLNRESLEKETSSEEFAKLYTEFKEFDDLDKQFEALIIPTLKTIMGYAIEHKSEFGMDKNSN